MAEAIEHQRAALLRVLAALFVQAGLAPGGTVATLPRHLRLALLRVLRPAESGARRLIYTLARELTVTLRPARPAPGTGKALAAGARTTRIPGFRLIDPRGRILPPSPKPVAGRAPNIWSPGIDRPVFSPQPPAPAADDPVTMTRICRRMQALQHALEDLPEQAARMARAMARRRLAPPGPGRVPPLRPGRPPGHRTRQAHPVDAILTECCWLAVLPAPADTS